MVNLSRALLCRQGVALAYKRILEGYGPVHVDGAAGGTESDDLDDGDLRPSGVLSLRLRIEIDDFRKAQSTLPMLAAVCRYRQADKSLIDCIGDRKGEIMLRQVVRPCYELGLYTTAEAWRPRIRWISARAGLHGYTGLFSPAAAG